MFANPHPKVFFLSALSLLSGCSVTTSGCTLPIDIVIGDACLLGSVGGSLVIAAVFFVGIALVALLYHWAKFRLLTFINNIRKRR